MALSRARPHGEHHPPGGPRDHVPAGGL